VGVQPIPVGRLGFETESVGRTSLLWRFIGLAERSIAAALLLTLLPALAVIALIIVFLSRRSPLIAHRRVGQAGRSIWVLKLRTMWDRDTGGTRLTPWIERLHCEALPELKSNQDARITSRFAAFCRKYSIDELPQLWQVLTGGMALVGPRPLMANEIETYYGADVVYLLSRKPGITGLWQVKGRSRLTYAQRKKLDLFLVRHWSFGLYVRILRITVPRVLAGKDAC
jgi:exopolysaccharide production protein ExoY